MESDDDIEWSIHNLDQAPEPPPPGARISPSLTSRRRLSSEDYSVRRRFMADEHPSMFHSRRRLASEDHPRPRFFSGSSLPAIPSFPSLTGNHSFPPSGRRSAEQRSSNGRRVGFATEETRMAEHEGGHLHLAEEPDREELQKNQSYESDLSSSNAERQISPSSADFSDQTSLNDEEDIFVTGEEEASSTTGVTGAGPVVVFGVRIPQFQSYTWRQLSEIVVRHAPCFWCAPFKQPTERNILGRLNVLCAFGTFFQIVSMIFSIAILSGPKMANREVPQRSQYPNGTSNTDQTGHTLFTNVWNLNGNIFILGILAFITFVSTVLTVRVIRDVNLVGAIRYLWVLLWVVPFEIYSVIGLFDYFRVTGVWIRHWWRDPSLAWLRKRFCKPEVTADTLCTVPIFPTASEETAWCIENFNSTSCSAIRDNAQDQAEKWMIAYYYVNAAWGLLVICLLLLVVNTLEGIISRPLVQKSRESNVPAWFSLPIIGCVSLGSLFAFSNSSVLNTRSNTEAGWLGPLYLITAGLFFCAAFLGWFISARSILSTRDKRQKFISIIGFIAVMAIILVLLATIFSTSIAFSISLVEIPIDNDTRGTIACFVDQAGGCTRCDEAAHKCPEWTTSDVTSLLQTQAKSSATMAAIFLLYAVAGLRFGFGMRRHIAMYQIDYV